MHHSGITSATNKATTVTNFCHKIIIVVNNDVITSDTTTKKLAITSATNKKFGNMAKLYIKQQQKATIL